MSNYLPDYPSLKDLFDLEGGDMPTLVEINMTNKHMRLKKKKKKKHAN